MSSDLFVDSSFFSDPFSPFPDSFLQFIFKEFHESGSNLLQDQIPTTFMDERDRIESVPLSSSPPSVQLENLSLAQLGNAAYSVESEDNPTNFDSGFGILPQSSYGAHETAVRIKQGSFSSSSFEHNQGCSFRPQFENIWESQFQNPILDSMERMRRVCSTGDLQKVKGDVETRNVLSGDKEAASFKGVGKYSAEERKERIHRYRAKRTHRKFSKTIKYACRKTLADNRQRVRGRFARNDEAGEISKTSRSYEDDDDLWMDGFHEEDEEVSTRK